MSDSQETFFRPPVHEERASAVPVQLYTLCRRALKRSGGHCAFVPIRSMQFQAVIDEDEVVFVDSQAYMVQRGVGGRVILLAWRFPATGTLDSLERPVPCSVIYYRAGLLEVQRRLQGEFTKALELLDQRSLERVAPGARRVLKFEKE